MGLADPAELATALGFSKEVCREAEHMLSRLSIGRGEHLKLLMAAKALRARALFTGTIALAEQKLTSPASALIRCLMEVKFTTLALVANPDWIADMVDTDAGQRVRAMRNLIRLPAEHRASSVVPSEIEAKLEELGAQKRGPSVAEWARRASCEDEYNLAYLLLSGDVHPALRGIEAHLILDENGLPKGLAAYPDVEELPFRLMHACDCYLSVLAAMPEGVLSPESLDKIHALNADPRKRGINERALAATEGRT